MKLLDLKTVLQNCETRAEVISAIKFGSIFVHPTDTVYGLGCNALKPKAVAKIREIKGARHPFSVIAPSKTWIKANLETRNHEKQLSRLPGPYTLIFKKKSARFLSAASALDSLGVRIPKHAFSRLVLAASVPFITTSANVSGQPAARSTKKLPKKITRSVDFVIDDGALPGKASTVIDLTKAKPTIMRQ